MMLEWFEANREVLESRGFVIHQMLSNPEAWWIEPSAFVEIETPVFGGTIETTIDGRCWYHFITRNEEIPDIEGRFLCLDPVALEYRKTDWYSGDIADVNIEPRYEIRQVSDYDHIFEPIISRFNLPVEGEELVRHEQDLNFIPVVRFSSVVVFDESLRVLLVCERKAGIEGLWGTPGGGDEPGEIPVQAAKRELYEETGLKNIELELLETLLWHGDRGDILMCHIFLAQVHSSLHIAPVFTDEILEVGWFDQETFKTMYENRMIRSQNSKMFVETAFRYVQAQKKNSGESA